MTKLKYHQIAEYFNGFLVSYLPGVIGRGVFAEGWKMGLKECAKGLEVWNRGLEEANWTNYEARVNQVLPGLRGHELWLAE